MTNADQQFDEEIDGKFPLVVLGRHIGWCDGLDDCITETQFQLIVDWFIPNDGCAIRAGCISLDFMSDTVYMFDDKGAITQEQPLYLSIQGCAKLEHEPMMALMTQDRTEGDL